VFSLPASYSRLLTALVGHLQGTKNANHEFSSGSFISWAHDQRELEAEHRLMKEAVHVDFVTGTTRSTVVFGTIPEARFGVIRAYKELMDRRVFMVSYLSQPY
jgi:hypothetical protein